MMRPGVAHSTAKRYLSLCLPRRWHHVQSVASRANTIAPNLDDGPLLVTACWLHDIGYSPELNDRKFHPLDGAYALRGWGVDEAICGLIAYHSAAAHEAEILGVFDELEETFDDQHGIVRDLLWYLDMTTSPDGDRVSFDDRMDEVRARYPADHYVSRALDSSMADRRGAVDRAEAWLSTVGLAGQV